MRIKGVTLVEIMIVLAIMTILIGMAVPGLTGLQFHYRLVSAARELTSDLRMARQMAITEGQKMIVVLDPQREGYQVERESAPGVPVRGVKEFKGLDLVSFSNSNSNNVIEFWPRGTTNDWGTIILQNPKGETRRITIVATGRVRLYEK